MVQQVATLEASEWYSRWPLWRTQSGTAGDHFGGLRVVQQVATLESGDTLLFSSDFSEPYYVTFHDVFFQFFFQLLNVFIF